MGFLDDLLRGAADTASRAYDQVNPFDGGKDWNQRTAQPAKKKPQQSPQQRQQTQLNPQAQQRLAASQNALKQRQMSVYSPLEVMKDVIGAGKQATDFVGHMATDTLQGVGNLAADFGQAGAEVIREATGQNAQQYNDLNAHAQTYRATANALAQKAAHEADPARRDRMVQAIHKLGVAEMDANRLNAQMTQRGLDATDPRKTLANAAETALDLATLGGGSVLVDTLKPAATQVTKQVAKQLLKNAGKTSLEGAGLGAAYGGVNTARDANATIGDYAKNIGQGAATGGALGLGAQIALPVAGQATKAAIKGGGRVASATQKGITRAVRKQEENAIRQAAQDKILTRVEPHYIEPSGKPLDQGIVSQHRADIINGNIDPIIVTQSKDGHMKVLDGEHRLQAYLDLGVPQVPTRVVTPGEVRNVKQGGYAKVPGISDTPKYQKQWKPHELMYLEQSARKAGNIEQANAYKIQREQMQASNANEADIASNPIPTPDGVSMSSKARLPIPGASGTLGDVVSTVKVSLPKNALSSGQRQRGLATTIQNDVNATPELKAKIGEMYNVRNTADLQARAANFVKDNPDTALHVFRSDSTSDVGTMIGGELSAHLSRTGQHEAALEVAQQMSRDATHRGQANQALSAWGKLAPESVLRFAQKTVNEYNKNAKLVGTKNELKITPEQAKSLADKSQKLQDMPAGPEKDIATQRMLNDVKELVPASWVKKLSTLQTIGQLFNVKTTVRNILGNAMFSPLEMASQTIATGIDKAASAARGTARTTALPNPVLQAKSVVKGAKQQWQETTNGVNLGPDTQYDLADVPTFRDGAMAKIEKAMGIALRVPDRAAFTAAYDDTVAGLMKVNNLEKPTQEILDQAEANALYRTFQDNSRAAKLFTKLKDALNTVGFEGKDGAKWGLGDMILKYPKTPGNIVSRGLDYSPVGIVKGLYQIVKPVLTHQAFDQHTFANATSRGIVGTGALMGAGATLGALGIITEKPSQDADTRNLQKSIGQGGYQINVDALKRFFLSGFNKDEAKLREGDTLVSYDWAQPASIPLSAGAALGKKQNPGDAALSTLDSVASGLNTLVEQPLVTGLNTFANNIKNKGVIGALGETAKGIPASFVPTAVNQSRQLTDNTTRNTYDSNAWQQSLNMAANKIPGLDRLLHPQVDSLGNDKQNYQNNTNSLFNVSLNPSFVSKYQPTDGARLPLDILNNTGKTSQMPLTPKTTQKVNGVNIGMTPDQNYQFDKLVGTMTNDSFKQFAKDPKFMALSQEDQAKKMSTRLSDINDFAKKQILGDAVTKNTSKTTKQMLSGQTNINPSYKTTSTGGSTIDVNPNLAKNYKDTLAEFDALDTTAKEKKLYADPSAEFRYEAAKYENKKASGTLTQAEQIKAEDKLAKLQAGAKFSKETRDLYSLSKKQLTSLIDQGKITDKQAGDILAYGDALKGIDGYNKFKDKNGNVAIRPKAKGSGGGRRSGGKGRTGGKKQLPSNSSAGTLSLVANLSKKAANTKIAKRSLPKNGGVRSSGVKAYKKVAKTNVSMTRKA